MDISIKQVRFILATIYGPNFDDQDFLKEFIDSIESIPNDNRVIGGDWNVVLDLNMDKEVVSRLHILKLKLGRHLEKKS